MDIAFSVPIGAWHPFLPSCLESLRIQGNGVRVCLLDASGDDRVKALADKYDNWFAYRRHGPDAGQSDAIIEGWQAVDSEWLGWLNADDLLMPDAITRIEEQLAREPSLDVIYGHSAILDQNGNMTGYHFNVEPPGPKLLNAGIISQPSCFFRRDRYNEIGGLDRDLHYVMDWDLWMRLYQSGCQFAFIDECLSMVLWGQDTKTASLNKTRRDEIKRLLERNSSTETTKTAFWDFVIHASVDRLQPKSLRRRVQRKLRSVGGSPFGIRGDGYLNERSRLQFAHYQDRDVVGMNIIIDGDPKQLELECSHGAEQCRNGRGMMQLNFTRALKAGEVLDVSIRKSTDAPIYFQRAEWRVGDKTSA